MIGAGAQTDAASTKTRMMLETRRARCEWLQAETFAFVCLAVGDVYPATNLEGALEAQQVADTDSEEPHLEYPCRVASR